MKSLIIKTIGIILVFGMGMAFERYGDIYVDEYKKMSERLNERDEELKRP